MSGVCTHCGQTLKLTHKETLTKVKLTMLKTAANYVTSNMKNEVPIRIFKDNTNFYNNFQKLRYHGLIHHLVRNGVRVPGQWLITRNGWSFLRGEIELPKWVLIKDNDIKERCPKLISVQDVYRGSDAIETTFAYFDEHGQPVGFLPTIRRMPEQVALI